MRNERRRRTAVGFAKIPVRTKIRHISRAFSDVSVVDTRGAPRKLSQSNASLMRQTRRFKVVVLLTKRDWPFYSKKRAKYFAQSRRKRDKF